MKTHLVAYLIVACSASLHGGSPAGKTQQLTSTDQVPEGLAKSDWSSIRAAYEAGRHAFQPVPGRDGVWQAHNPGQQWLTTFDQRGFEAKPVGGDWSWGLELKSYGFGEKQTLIGGTPTVKAAGQRLSYQWNAAVQEWWVNDQRGLEHGFTLSERPPLPVSSSPASPLAFTLGTRGNLKPKISADALEVQFQDSTGATVLNYSGLKVWDADGVILPSRFESAGLSGFRLLVDQSSARYPITIDPVAQQAYFKASQVNSGDHFGWSVAVSGDIVVVGAYQEDSSTTGVNSSPNELATDAGAAYVFVRSGSTWSQQAYLKASQVNAGDKFGWSVAVSGDTVVVGAIYEDSSTTGVNSTPNESAESAGAAYVFVRSSSTWSQQTYLKASQVNEFDEFGWSVAVSGNTVVVGARFEDSSTTGVNSTPNELASEAGAAYIFTGLGPTPDIAVTQAAAVADAGSTDFGPVTLGSSSAPLTFTVTNPGTADLTSLVVNKDGLNAADFTVSALSGTSVSMGGSVTFTVTFYPSTAGSKTAAIHIASNVAGAKNPFDIEVTGTGTALPEAVITVQPLSRLVLLGSAASFNPVVTGDEPMTLQWKKGTMVINGATLSTYTIPLTKTSDMGAYILTADNPVGPPVTSRPAYLGIVTPMVGTQVIKKGAALNLKATVVAPTVIGMVLRYSWRRGPDVLGNGIQPNGAVVSGADKAALSITKMGMDDAGTYSCLITLDTPGNDPQIVNGETVIRVVDAPPVMDPIPLPVTAFVGQMIDVTVSATNFPSGFQVTGLPLGLKLDVKTGRITGQPTTGSKKDNVGNFIPSKITFKATNAFGTGAGLDFFMTTQPLPAGVAGSYTGLVARDTRPGGTEELGGVVTFTVTGGSSVTGKLTLLGKQQPFTTSLRTAVDGLTGAVLARVSFPRPTAVTAALLVDMTLTVTPATRSISGELQWTGVAGTFTTLMSGWQNQTVPLVTGAGLYNSALLTHSPESDLAYPQGTGYLTLNVTPTGLATWGGKLSDNNTITGSSNLGPAGQVPVHLLLYTNTGSVQGWAQITGNDVDGTLDWFKAPQPVKSTTRSYKGGFLRHDLTVDGGKYIKPATGSILLGLPSSVQIGLTGGGLSPAINQAFTITTANVAQVPTNTNNVKVTLTATTGLFTGSFTQPGLTATTPRKADIFGAFIPSSASGVGFFNLPENPDAAGETPTNTPMHSGAMEIKAP